MALRISSAEIVSSAMGCVLFPAGSVCGVGEWGRSAGQPTAGFFQAMGDAAVDDLVAHLDDETAEHARVDGHLQAHRPPVEPGERVDEPLLLLERQCDRAGHAG